MQIIFSIPITNINTPAKSMLLRIQLFAHICNYNLFRMIILANTQGTRLDLNRLFRVRNLMVFRVFSFRVKKNTLNKMVFRVLLFKVKKRLFRAKKDHSE